MIDIKQEAEKLLEYAGISATQRDIDFAADALRSFAERVRKEAIEECAVLLEQQQPETLSESLLALANVKDIRHLKQKTNGTDR